MKRIATAAAAAAMTIALTVFSGAAFAGDHNGDGGGDKSGKAAQQQSQPDGKSGGGGDQSKPSKSEGKPESASNQQPQDQQKPQDQGKPQDQQKQQEPADKVYICHATGSASNPYVLIHVSSHALPAHTKHQDGRDIVLGSSPGPCPGASTSGVKGAEHTDTQAQMVSFCDMETVTTGKFETKSADKVVKHELDGKPEEARDIVPTFSYNGQTYSQLWDANGQAIYAAHCNQARRPPRRR